MDNKYSITRTCSSRVFFSGEIMLRVVDKGLHKEAHPSLKYTKIKNSLFIHTK